MQTKRLNGRVALITGASRGIGRGIAYSFAQEGAHIVFTYYSNQQEAEATRKLVEQCGVQCHAIQADSSRETDIGRVAKVVRDTFGGINILVNNAGTLGVERSVVDMPVEEWDHIMNVDLRGVFLCCKYFVPLMKDNCIGKIINISSELSRKGRAKLCHYVAAKAGINGLTRALALELAPDILVNALAPGPIATDMILKDMTPGEIESEKEILLNRLGEVEEISATAVHLAADEGNFFCGQWISPNGGAVFN